MYIFTVTFRVCLKFVISVSVKSSELQMKKIVNFVDKCHDKYIYNNDYEDKAIMMFYINTNLIY